MINSDFLSMILEQYAPPDTRVYIADASTRIHASTDPNRVGSFSDTARYILHSAKPTVIESATTQYGAGDQELVTYGAPLFFDGELSGCIIVHAQHNIALTQGNLIKAAIETAFSYHRYSESILSQRDECAAIAAQILSDNVNVEAIISMMNSIEMDPSLLRCVICISLNHHKANYFNINLNLGYQSSIERINHEVAARLKSSKYLNSQDILYSYDRNTIVVIKSFVPVKDYSKIYLSLDKICQDFEDVLDRFTSFSFYMAYGNLYQDLADLKKSHLEACKTIDIGRRTNPQQRFFVLDNILYEAIFHSLNTQIINKIILPTITKLTGKDNVVRTEMVDCAEAYIDCCMNLSETSAKIFLHRNTISARLEKLRTITGLDPANSFSDAFIVKMLALYLRFHQED